MKIVFFETMPGERESLMAQLPPGHDIQFLEEKLAPDTADKATGAEIVSVFVKSEVTASVIDQLPDLKLITTRSMGYDHIDIEHAKAKDIKVGNVQTYASHPVAEFTYALLMCVSRKIYQGYNQLREGTDFDQRGLTGFNLFGKTLGVAGTGRIGKNVVAIAKGFGLNILAFDTFPDQEFADAQGFQYVSLEELASKSDIITIHVPYTKETHHLIDAKMFARMKKGVVIINTARGEIIDTHALIAALRDGTVAGAGLDVLEEERNLKEEVEVMVTRKPDVDYELLTANHILIDMPNVVVTPHVAFETVEAMREIERVTAETISSFLMGKEQKYL
jgi:D-lactate dehydrogenase